MAWALVYVGVQVGHTVWVDLFFQLDTRVYAVGIGDEGGEVLFTVCPDEEYVIQETFVAERLECGPSEHVVFPISHEDVGEGRCILLSHRRALELQVEAAVELEVVAFEAQTEHADEVVRGG